MQNLLVSPKNESHALFPIGCAAEEDRPNPMHFKRKAAEKNHIDLHTAAEREVFLATGERLLGFLEKEMI